MVKNLMPEVAKLLGVEIGEKFKIQALGSKEDDNSTILAWLTEQGLCVENNYVCNDGENKYLVKALTGELKIFKLPWEPKNCDDYYILNVETGRIECYSWGATTFDLAVKSLGIIYRTEEEAKAHMSEDYERLTGNKLEEQAIVKIPWEPKRGESYYAMSIVGCAQPKIACYDWNGSAADYECLKNGLVHKTQAEAEEHFAEDYERLTGKKPEG